MRQKVYYILFSYHQCQIYIKAQLSVVMSWDTVRVSVMAREFSQLYR